MLLPLRDNVIIAALDDPNCIILPSGCIISKEDANLIPYIYNTPAGGATKKRSGYFCLRGTASWRQNEYVHRVIIKRALGESDLHADHINSNRFDNRRINLRYITARNNAARALRGNSKYYRVSFNKRRQMWRVSVRPPTSNKAEDFGYYKSEVEAAYWGDVWETRFNNNPVLNFPDNINFYVEENLLLDTKQPWAYTPPTLEELYANSDAR